MTHRHYGVPVAKPRPTYTGPARAAAWSGGAIIIGGIMLIVIMLAVILYGVTKIISVAGNTATSAPHTIGEASRPPVTPPSSTG
jgi:hypothetical protein